LGIATTNSVIQGIGNILNSHYPQVPLMNEELSQGMTAPSFYVKMVKCEHEQELGDRYKRRISFDIQYHDSGIVNMHSIAEQLFNAMELISIDAMLCRGKGMYYEISGGILHFFVSYEVVVKREPAEVSNMQKLELRRELVI